MHVSGVDEFTIHDEAIRKERTHCLQRILGEGGAAWVGKERKKKCRR